MFVSVGIVMHIQASVNCTAKKISDECAAYLEFYPNKNKSLP